MRAAALISVLVLVLAGCKSAPKILTSLPQNKLNHAALLLDSESIGAIRVVHSPPSEHPSRIALDALLLHSPYSLELSETALDARRSRVAVALRSSDAVNADWSGDVNWGMVLYDHSGKEMIRIGFDESGRRGFVGTDAVRMNDNLLGLCRKLMPE